MAGQKGHLLMYYTRQGSNRRGQGVHTRHGDSARSWNARRGPLLRPRGTSRSLLLLLGTHTTEGHRPPVRKGIGQTAATQRRQVRHPPSGIDHDKENQSLPRRYEQEEAGRTRGSKIEGTREDGSARLWIWDHGTNAQPVPNTWPVRKRSHPIQNAWTRTSSSDH